MRLALDHLACALGRDDTVGEPLGVAADRGERRLQLVADGEQERPLGVLGAVELLRELVEGGRELAELGRPLDRQRLGALAFREASARLGDPGDGAGDGAREQERGDGREDGAEQGGEREADEEGIPVGGLVAGGAEEHDRIPAAEPGGVHERLTAHVDRPVRVALRAQQRGGLRRQEQLRLRRRQDREPLLLGREEAAEGRLPGRQRVRGMLGDDQVDLAVEGAPGVVVERAAGESGADGEHHDRRHGERGGDPDEEPAPQRAWAVEPSHVAAL